MRDRENLKARQASEIAHIYYCPYNNNLGFYTSSQGGCKWDPRRFNSRAQAVEAALAAGFFVPYNERYDK